MLWSTVSRDDREFCNAAKRLPLCGHPIKTYGNHYKVKSDVNTRTRAIVDQKISLNLGSPRAARSQKAILLHKIPFLSSMLWLKVPWNPSATNPITRTIQKVSLVQEVVIFPFWDCRATIHRTIYTPRVPVGATSLLGVPAGHFLFCPP